MNDSHDLEVIFRSHIPILIIETREERRTIELLRSIIPQIGKPLYRWTVTEGLVSLEFSYALEDAKVEPAEVLLHIKSTAGAGVYVLVDFHPYLSDPVHVRLLKDIALQYERHKKHIVLLSHDLEIPPEIGQYSAGFRLSLPDKKAVQQIVREVAAKWAKDNAGQRVKADKQALDKLISNLSGLTAGEIRRLAQQVIYDDGAISQDDIPRVMKAKYDLLNQDGILQFEYETEKFTHIGGFNRLRAWLAQRKQVSMAEASTLDRPKGIMLLGVQGCGKSLAAKATAGDWGLPLLRLDVGALFNKYHGETEKNLRETLKAAEAMAPCVLWVDEIEKGFSSQDNDSGTSKRVLGTLLTWMAENESAVFLVATANDISAIPPELIRKGRLDEIFFVDLPDFAARRNIFEIHLRKREQDPIHFSLGELARMSKGYSGAEIEQAIVAAMYSAYAKKEKLADQHLLDEIRQTRPLSVLMAEKIEALRDWAKDRTVSAN